MRAFKPQKGPRLPGPIDIRIDKLSHDGRGIGRYQGRVVMVENALVGEQVRVQVDRGNTRLWQGHVVDYLTQSEHRQVPACQYYGQCGGCQLQHLPVNDQIALKQQTVSEHLQRNGLTVPEFDATIASAPFGYRHRARFHVSRKGALGFHTARGQQVVAIDRCPVLTDALQAVTERIQREAPLQGLQQLEVAVDDQDQAGARVVKASATGKAAFERWYQDQSWLHSGALRYRAGDHWLAAQPGEFTQVNRSVNTAMLQQISRWLAPGKDDRLLDLFCGNGNISLSLAPQVGAVLGLEASETAIEAARKAADGHSGLRFEVADLFTQSLQDWSVVGAFDPTIAVLDPPRAGAEQVSHWLPKLTGLSRLVYVSCDPATLARDLALLAADKWHLRKACLIDMFPQTRHIETMVLLEKK